MPPHIYRSTYPSFQIPTDLSFSQFLLAYNPDDIKDGKVILEEFDDPTKSATYGGLRELAAKGAAGLRSVLGMREGDIAVVLAQNSLDWVVLAQSLMWCGGVLCVINPLATPHELVHYLGIAGPSIIFVEREFEGNVREALKMMGKIKSQPKIALIGSPAAQSPRTTVHLEDIFNHQQEPLPPLDLSQKDNRETRAAMIFSSGTSGKPKGVLLSHYNLIAYILGLRASDPLLYNGFQREVFYASFSHIYGIISVVALAPFCGHFVVIMKNYQFNQYIEHCATIRSTILRLVPATAVSMTRDPRVEKLDLTSVQTIMCSGAPLQGQVVQKLQAMMAGTSIIQGYGLSEGTVSLLRGPWSVQKAGSVGRLGATAKVRVVDDDYNDVQPGEPGELLLKTATLFMGYKDNPEATASAFKDSWFCTGDVVTIDSEGFLWLTARKKELIKYKGNQVSPTELEEVLLSHPKVKEAAVCGVFDRAQQTEVPVAYVNFHISQLGEDFKVLLQEVKEFVDKRVSPYKRLRGGVHYLEEIPKNASGKVLRRLLPAKAGEERKSISDRKLRARL